MKHLNTARCTALAAAFLLAPAAGADTAPKKTYTAVFDFASKPAHLGRQLADSVRLYLRRHDEYEVIDQLTTREAASAMPASADAAKVTALMKDTLGVNLAICGSAQQAGEMVRAEVKVIDLTDPAKPRQWEAVFSDGTERARGVIARQVVEAVRKQAEWRPPEYGDEPEPQAFGDPLNANGSFEAGAKGWDAPDNASTFLVAGPAGRGRVLKIKTDLERHKWLDYRRKLRLGLADATKPPKLAKDTSYGSVAGLEGVHYRGEFLRASPGGRYWLTADMKGKTAGIFFPKVFVKGYLDYTARAAALPEVSLVEMKLKPEDFAALPPAEQKQLIGRDVKAHPDRYRRECFRWYLACRNEEDVWMHYAAPFPPRGGLPKNVEYLRIEVYAYWPPGEFLFDNVHLYADPGQKAPLPEEKPRTPNFRGGLQPQPK